MSITSLEEFEKKVEAKRARLLKDLELAKALPTNGKTVSWMGEAGYEKDGHTRKPDREYSITIEPHIVHAPFRGAEHVAFRIPEDWQHTGKGEYRGSKHRNNFVLLYFRALLEACRPFMIPTLAIEGYYKSLVPETFDYKQDRDYKDAQETARGLFEVEISHATGQHGYRAAKLGFYIRIPEQGTVQITLDLENDFQTWGLQARAHMSGSEWNSVVASWSFPTCADVGAVKLYPRSNCDRNSYGQPSGYTMEWLFASEAAMLKAIGIGKE